MIVGKTLLAGFLATQAALLVACLLVMLRDGGFGALPQGGMLWLRFQIGFIPVALVISGVCVAIRSVMGPLFLQNNRIALLSGAGLGLAVAAGLLLASADTGRALSPSLLGIGVLAGFLGGWVWWWFEKPREMHP